MSDSRDGAVAGSNRPAAVPRPLVPPIYPASVYCCDTPQQASQLLAGTLPGYVYSRDGHPNATMLAQRCAELHGAERAVVTGSGMAALALALLSQLSAGDHAVVSNQLYGRSLSLFTHEAARLGIHSTLVNTCDTRATEAAFSRQTRLLLVETITNPLLRVSDIAALADIAHRHNAILLVDNTFASPAFCRPLDFGADLVMESITKIMNGHSDVMLGLLCGKEQHWQRVAEVHSTWGYFASPMDCWLAQRGLGTLALRAQRAAANAQAIAGVLAARAEVATVSYPGLPAHPDQALAARQLRGGFGNMVTFTLHGGLAAAERFIEAVRETIPFCPSLGELTTTLSHPESTSHRALTASERDALGIDGGTIRLSLGVEAADELIRVLQQALADVG